MLYLYGNVYNKFRSEEYEDILMKTSILYTSNYPFTRALRDALDDYIDEVRDSLTRFQLQERRENLIFAMSKLIISNDQFIFKLGNGYLENKDRVDIVIRTNTVVINIDGKCFTMFQSNNHGGYTRSPPTKNPY